MTACAEKHKISSATKEAIVARLISFDWFVQGEKLAALPIADKVTGEACKSFLTPLGI